MRSEDRIRRMQADGLLSDAQAAMLRDSLGSIPGRASGDADARAGHRKRRAVSWLLGVAGAVIAVVLIMTLAGTGGDVPTIQDVRVTLNEPGGIGQMNRNFSGLLAIALFLIAPLLLWMWLHNSLVAKEEQVYEAWAQTESNLERRADLIPALVETVSRYLRHESETLTAVTAERSRETLSSALDELIAAQKASAELVAKDRPNIVDREADLAALFAAQQEVGARMHSFLAVAESYPELRSSDQFLELQAQLEGTENRINVARMRFNESVGSYNAAIRKLPSSLVARAGGFSRKAYFEAGDNAHDTPELAFD